jgi:hypothetical protein
MSILDRICKTCGISSEIAQLEKCGVCSKYFCADCAHRAFGGRKFCTPECARGYYFQGEVDDDDEDTERIKE